MPSTAIDERIRGMITEKYILKSQMKKIRIGDLLVQQGKITDQQLEEALVDQKKRNAAGIHASKS